MALDEPPERALRSVETKSTGELPVLLAACRVVIVEDS